MIVKDEADVIERCLASVKPVIDHWVIVDTGSSDGTQEIIHRFMADTPGELHERPWRNFGHNRTEALELARGKADYILIMDADNLFCTPPKWHWPVLIADAYELTMVSAGVHYQQCVLVADRLPWRWIGVLHEYLASELSHQPVALPGPWVDRRHEGARSRDPYTFRKDAALLETALQAEPNNARYAFYLAQSWRDAGEPIKAREAYRHRVALGGWEEETWYSLYEVAKLTERLQESADQVRSAYLEAYQFRPSRAEPLYQLARFHRERSEWALALLFATQAAAIPRPSDRLFIEESVYRWSILDELGTAAYWVGAFSQGRQAIEKILAEGYVPASDLSRIQTNLSFFPPADVTSVPAHDTKPSAHTSTKTLGHLFSNIYENDIWDGGSGPGSRLENIKNYHDYLQEFLRNHHIRSIVDCGCGDWQSTRYLDLKGIRYTGIDIVPFVIEANQKAYGQAEVRFVCGNFSEMDLPLADLAICKDALQHLPDESVTSFLGQLHKFKYVLITNDLGDNRGRDATLSSNPYHFARLDITQAPFLLEAERVCEMPGDKVTHLVTNTQQWLTRQSVKIPVEPNETHNVPYQPTRAKHFQSTPLAMVGSTPKVMLAILAKQKEATLPFYLRCIEALDYPKSAIALYIRTNNNTDRTSSILHEWVDRVGTQYASVEFDDSDVATRVQQYGVHEWNETRFKVLGHIRQVSLQRAIDAACDFYFVVDVDNFVRPCTLRDLVALNLPIVGPLLRHEAPQNPYSNYHHAVDANGYFADSEEYYWLLNQRIRGVAEVQVIHCTYLIRRDCLPAVRYDDGSQRHEYVVFSSSARAANIGQYLDTRQVYGYLTLDENAQRCEALIGAEVVAAMDRT